jgi:F-box protein 9
VRKSLLTSLRRTLVEDTYQVPQITAEDSVDNILELYKTVDYRRVYVEHPRVRLDGVYIAVCHYV